MQEEVIFQPVAHYSTLRHYYARKALGEAVLYGWREIEPRTKPHNFTRRMVAIFVVKR